MSGLAFTDERVFCAISDGGADSDNPMTIAIPAGTVCTGGSSGNACLLRVTNPPGFGSCFAIARRSSKLLAELYSSSFY